MYSVSNDFKAAVADGEPQICLLLFDDAVFSNEDIDVDRGVEMHDYFNMEQDLAIGQTLSNEIRFTLFNDDGYLDRYKFGDFTATIGVRTLSTKHKPKCEIYVKGPNNVVYKVYGTAPYIWRVEGETETAFATQPTQPIICVAIYDGSIYCFGRNGYYIVYKTTDNTVKSVTVNRFTREKFEAKEYIGYYYNKSSKKLRIYDGESIEEYEFAPLGVFTAERPNIPEKIAIDLTCFDQMQKFDKKMPTDSELGVTYPITFRNYVIKLCDYVDVAYNLGNFINYNAQLVRRPREFDNATMRQVIGWFAEAAGSNAKFNRDGELIMDWMRTTTKVMDENDYETFNTCWYETKTIDKLVNRNTQGGGDRVLQTAGSSGKEAYLIQDNPLLRGVS